ncbi:hypothetical protein EYF80_044329 [Liparis tanakae]|uniref:Uncharacterized protein n=1 Tax=Liparis tanakae TaxID=230148 RepID=A0A4Z2FX22_9TELE|nr:hypothetical protein EYF80_044329 [Liparis tanakae]
MKTFRSMCLFCRPRYLQAEVHQVPAGRGPPGTCRQRSTRYLPTQVEVHQSFRLPVMKQPSSVTELPGQATATLWPSDLEATGKQRRANAADSCVRLRRIRSARRAGSVGMGKEPANSAPSPKPAPSGDGGGGTEATDSSSSSSSSSV